MYCVLYIWYICILFSVKEYFIFKYIKCFLNSSVSLPRKRHTQGVYKLETILKWEDYIKKNCLFLGELTIKRHSYLGEFVPSLIQYCKKCFWNKRIFCRNLGKLTCISHVLSAGRRHCGFPSSTWTILLLKKLYSHVWDGELIVFSRGFVGKSSGWYWWLSGFPWSSNDG